MAVDISERGGRVAMRAGYVFDNERDEAIDQHACLAVSPRQPRREIVRRLAGALAPGGVLLLEEWDTRVREAVLTAPTPLAAGLYRRSTTAWSTSTPWWQPGPGPAGPRVRRLSGR